MGESNNLCLSSMSWEKMVGGVQLRLVSQGSIKKSVWFFLGNYESIVPSWHWHCKHYVWLGALRCTWDREWSGWDWFRDEAKWWRRKREQNETLRRPKNQRSQYVRLLCKRLKQTNNNMLFRINFHVNADSEIKLILEKGHVASEKLFICTA